MLKNLSSICKTDIHGYLSDEELFIQRYNEELPKHVLTSKKQSKRDISCEFSFSKTFIRENHFIQARHEKLTQEKYNLVEDFLESTVKINKKLVFKYNSCERNDNFILSEKSTTELKHAKHNVYFFNFF